MTKSTAKLSVISNELFKKEFKPSCTVKLDSGADRFTEFVVVGHDEETDHTTLLHHADALTLGQALLLVHKAYQEALNELPEDVQQNILSILGVAQ